MDPAIMNKLQEMEEEMNRFEQEIAVPQVSQPVHYNGPVISNTGHSIQFLPHQIQRTRQNTISRPAVSDSGASSSSKLHSVEVGAVNHLPGIHPDIAATLPASSGLYLSHSADYGQAIISAPPQPSVIKAAPAVYMAPPVKTQPKVEEVVTPIPQIVKPIERKPPETPVIPTYIPPYIRQLGPAASVSTSHEDSTNKVKARKKKMVRAAGGQHWEDNSLLEWDPDDFRIFCGDLGNDVTDEVLTRAFGKFPSFSKARVVRDKRNNKTKGYGFVSFKDPQDFIRAMKEMNGKYVGSRPIKLRKSTWKDRNIESVRKKNKEKHRLGLR